MPPPENFDPEIPVPDPSKRKRGKGIYRRPGFSKYDSAEKLQKLVEKEAGEAADLADDSFFFAQFKKNNKKRNKQKSKNNKKSSRIPQKHVEELDKDIVFVHGNRALQSERLTNAIPAEEVDYLENDDNGNDTENKNVNGNVNINEEPDYYDDVESEKGDVEDVNPDYEIVEVETEWPVERVKPRRRLKPKHKRRPVHISRKPQPVDPIQNERRFHFTEIVNIHPKKKSIRPKKIHTIKHKKTNRIVETRKFHEPEQLYAEIDKIFDQKQRNYAKRGHDKTHWELRILPRHYEDYDY